MRNTGWYSAALPTAAILVACSETTAPPHHDLALGAPVVGAPMVDIFYGAYIDHHAGTEVRDYSCGIKSYDGHLGVDILLRNFREQDAGVPVIAAAEGTVVTVMDGFPDRNTTWDRGGGFGNRVILEHEGGVRTIYAHLRRESIPVVAGERVERGATLGLVGSSGRSNWPHLHFEVHHDGVVVEPFEGPCGASRTMWDGQLAYQDSFMVTDAGLTEETASLATLLERPPTRTAFPLDTDRFLFWLQVANQRAAVVRFDLVDPDGEVGALLEATVDPAFSMRYLILDLSVDGTLTEPGDWEIRTYQDGEMIWTQPFSLTEAVDTVSAVRGATSAPRTTFGVLDQIEGAAGSH